MPLKGVPTPHELARVRQAIDYLLHHHTEKITAEGLAFDARMELKLFRKLFLELAGDQVHNYLLKTRVAYAKEQLGDFSLTVAEIAYKNGFSTGPHFCKIFKDIEGIAPTEYRFQLMTNNSQDQPTISPKTVTNPLESAKRAS